MTAPDDGGLTAALLQITAHAERLGQLEARVSANLDECQVATGGITGAITDLRLLVEEQGRLLAAVDELVKTIAPPEGETGPGYKPKPPVLWWKLKADELQKATDHLAGWVEQVYRPWYGHLAGMLAPCWRDHPLVLVGLDVVSELHSTLWLQPKRSASLLSAQAEYQTRILPAFAEQFRAETSKCSHRPTAADGIDRTWRGGAR
jgi:hypothetical protein